jgi:iron complex outermembrane receptor protein
MRKTYMLLIVVLAGEAGAQQVEPPLADFTLEQLSEVVVTSVSRQPARLGQAPASIFRITAADIRRSGATTLAEALRLAPNLQVARVDARTYAITARGFSSALVNKLLVLVDGRSIYSPLFSGVFWDQQDVLMEDIERIEVISGPGGTIWGANAVNGVINVMTKHARQTQGSVLTVAGGNQERNASVRTGGRLGNGGSYRLYARRGGNEDFSNERGREINSGRRHSQAGFRTDWEGDATEYTVQGDVYQGTLGQGSARDIRTKGANLLMRTVRHFDNGSDVRVQGYADHTARDQGPGNGAQKLDTIDLEFQHSWRPLGPHQLTWGAGYRSASDRIVNAVSLQFKPANAHLHWGNLFAQDEFAVSDALRLTAGLKFEHNNYTNGEWLPNLRAAWSVTPSHLIWASLSRAIRAPSRIDRDLFIVNAAGRPAYLVEPNPAYASETAQVAELAYRGQPTPNLSLSFTLFGARYDKLRTLEPRPGAAAVFRNLAQGQARGIEMWASWKPVRSWTLSGGAVVQDIDTRPKPGSMDQSAGGLATNDPSHYMSLRSAHDLAHNVQLDFGVRRVGRLPRPAVPAYTELDARIAWQPRAELEVALSGQNLLHASHPEFGAVATRQRVERSVLLTMSWRF